MQTATRWVRSEHKNFVIAKYEMIACKNIETCEAFPPWFHCKKYRVKIWNAQKNAKNKKELMETYDVK